MMSLLTVLSLALVSLAIPGPFPEPEIQELQARGLAAVYSSCREDNAVALTFDDGPYIYEWDVAGALNAHGIKGTFFVNGNNWDCIYDQVDEIRATHAAGHMFASHTWSHPDLTTLSWDEIHDQMWRVEEALMKILGVYPAFMRPPYGNYNDLVRSAAAVRNQSLVLWDFDSGDSTGASVGESENLYQQIANQRPDNILALNHETYETTAKQVLPAAISILKAKGYRFVTVAECLGLPMYQWTSAPSAPDGSWHC